MSHDSTDETLKILLRSVERDPIDQLWERKNSIGIGTFEIERYRPMYSDGWTHAMRPESCVYKRWFDFRDLCMRGWALMFHVYDPVGDQSIDSERLVGWVPPERVAEADRWIEILNDQIRARFRERAAAAQPAAVASKQEP